MEQRAVQTYHDILTTLAQCSLRTPQTLCRNQHRHGQSSAGAKASDAHRSGQGAATTAPGNLADTRAHNEGESRDSSSVAQMHQH